MRQLTLIFVYALCFTVDSRDCWLSCDEVKITNDKKICYQNCDMKYIIGFTVGGTFLILTLVCLYCFCWGKKIEFTYFQFKKLKEKYNINLDKQGMKEDKFNEEMADFRRALQLSTKVNNHFFTKQDVQHVIAIKNVDEFVKEAPLLYYMQLNGEDYFEKWKLQGYFMCMNGQIFIWFLKEYENPQNAIQKGLRRYLIFEGKRASTKCFTGKWFCKDEQRDPALNGSWNLVVKKFNLNNELIDIRSQN